MTENEKKYRDYLEEMVEKRTAELKEEIAERKNAEKKLLESEKKYRILTETVPDIIFTLDRKGRFTYINPAGENIVGYSSQEFLGHNFTEILAPEYIESTTDRFKRGLAGEGISLYEVEIMHKDGQKVPVELNVTSLFDEEGNIIGRLGVTRDITESKQIQKVLRESEEPYRTIFENTGTAMVILEEYKTISLANAEFERLSGYSRKEIEGKKKLTGFVVEEYLEKMKDYHEQRRVDPTSAPKRYEFRFIDRKVNIRDILLSIDVIPGTKMSVASLLDITERRKAEEELKKQRTRLEELVKERTMELKEKTLSLKDTNNKLEKIGWQKSMFIASMSHELRTPLNSIIGFTGIILQGKSGEISEEQRKQLTMVNNSAKHLLALINDIIDINKIEAGKIEPIIANFNLSSIMHEVKESFRIAAAEKGIEITMEIPENLVIKSDERRVEQVIMNLVSNAVKFTERGEIGIKMVRKDGTVEISVRDTGIGIKQEDMDKLFKPFSQIYIENIEGMPKQESTGLGLYLSKKNADLLNCEISAESEFGKGSKLVFSLPLKYEEEEGKEKNTSS